MKLRNGGSWSFFGCPVCGRKAQTLRLLGAEILCARCLKRRGVYNSSMTMSVLQRAENTIYRLRKKLEPHSVAAIAGEVLGLGGEQAAARGPT